MSSRSRTKPTTARQTGGPTTTNISCRVRCVTAAGVSTTSSKPAPHRASGNVRLKKSRQPLRCTDRRFLQQNLPQTAVSNRGKTVPLLDQLVGGHQQCLRDRQAQRLCGFEVYGKIEFCRLLDRQLGRTCAFQNAPDIVQANFAISSNVGGVAH